MANSENRAGAGRPKGSTDRYSREKAARIRDQGFVEPLNLLLMIANDPEVDVDTRRRAAKDAAPYVHRRKPVAFEVAGKFEFLSPEERESRRQLLLEEIRTRTARTNNRN